MGGIFRTADGAGAKKVYLIGYTPAPASLKSIYKTQAQKMIAKTALGSEVALPWEQKKGLSSVIAQLKQIGYEVVALEQDEKSIPYDTYVPKKEKVAVILGNEPRGLDKRTLKKCDTIVEIPMHGSKNSLNVVVALGIIGYKISE